MKLLTKKQEEEIRALEHAGDAFLEKETFEDCLSASVSYLDAMNALHKYAQDESIDDNASYPHFKTDVISYKNWYFALRDKQNKAHTMLANPKMALK